MYLPLTSERHIPLRGIATNADAQEGARAPGAGSARAAIGCTTSAALGAAWRIGVGAVAVVGLHRHRQRLARPLDEGGALQFAAGFGLHGAPPPTHGEPIALWLGVLDPVDPRLHVLDVVAAARLRLRRHQRQSGAKHEQPVHGNSLPGDTGSRPWRAASRCLTST